MLGIRTRGRRMVGANKTTELWRSAFNCYKLLWSLIKLPNIIFLMIANFEQEFVNNETKDMSPELYNGTHFHSIPKGTEKG